MADALRRGTVSARELVEMHIARVRRYDEAINAVVVRDFARATRHAADADAARARGDQRPFLGVPVTIKDCMHVAGLPTTSGLPKRATAIAATDSPVVASLKAAGMVVLGKTNTAPYAGDTQSWNALFGRTNNPWSLDRTPGGSSGGSAAAVAAGMTPLDIGSDLAGSIRQPAAFCGVYGHKPSETAVPRAGHVPGSLLPNTATCMDVQGPIARSATDLRRVVDILAGPEIGEDVAWRIALPSPRHDELRAFRVAILPTPGWLEVDHDIQAAIENLARTLSRLGAVVAMAQPEGVGDLREHHLTFLKILYAITAHGSTEERVEAAARLRDRGTDEAAAQAEALLAPASVYIKWCDDRETIRQSFRHFFRHWDVLLTPAHCVNAFPHDERPVGERDLTVNGRTVDAAVETVFPALASLGGQPATVFTAAISRAGLPIGLQAIGPYLEDHTPLRMVEMLADELGSFQPPPGYSGI
ncbi:amidase family protein [Micromonospora sp. NPDC049662]|uniref:amidase family protein n=1 Tax=Micromonospora sp. NPDC049662 TaxID=3155397 RepID=UPI00343721FF